ncbi:hypothetical protein DPEC_G00288260 [Dallia pectoralis]|uniref:Uncharacterized protein n=1 Tax=Dallia pectoralis TaxID=75939 RepID=A0ACC2FKN4_DALPE|nr:hypothetical protein DPEC_G00288260 [Dallia pectoralis]
MQRHHQVNSSTGPDHHFDMWHDYLNLGKMLQELCDLTDRKEITCSDLNEFLPELDIRPTRSQEEHHFRSDSIGTGSRASSIFDYTTCSPTAGDFCGFCKQNGETAAVYRSHRLKCHEGKVRCPILRSYTCPMCGATGDTAHTRRYCRVQPHVAQKNWGPAQ